MPTSWFNRENFRSRVPQTQWPQIPLNKLPSVSPSSYQSKYPCGSRRLMWAGSDLVLQSGMNWLGGWGSGLQQILDASGVFDNVWHSLRRNRWVAVLKESNLLPDCILKLNSREKHRLRTEVVTIGVTGGWVWEEHCERCWSMWAARNPASLHPSGLSALRSFKADRVAHLRSVSCLPSSGTVQFELKSYYVRVLAHTPAVAFSR